MRPTRCLLLPLALLAVLWLCGGCQRAADDGDGPAASETAAVEPPAASTARGGERAAAPAAAVDAVAATPSARLSLAPWRELLEATGEAELEAGGGLWVDLGRAGAEVYTLGGWLEGWRRPPSGSEGEGRWLEVSGARALLALPPAHGGVREVVVRARSGCAEARLGVELEGDVVAQAPLEAAWSIVRLTLPRALESSGAALPMLRLSVSGRCAGEAPSRAELDWLWLAASAGGAPPADLIVGAAASVPLELGGRVRRALPVPGSRTWAFYLDVPAEARFVVDLGSAAAGTRFTVRVRDGGGAATELLATAPEPGRWHETVLDLGRWAGQVVRLELAAQVPPAPDGGAERPVGGLGEPALMTPAPNPAPRADSSDPAPRADSSDPAPRTDSDAPAPHGAPAPRANSGAPAGAATARNVVFVVIDTVRADSFAPLAPDTPVQTPAYARLAETSTVWVRAWNNANWTKPSVATMLSGLYPFAHGAQAHGDVLPSAVALLPEQLRDAGLATGGFVANGFVSARFGFARGWDVFRNFAREGGVQNAEAVYGDALAWIEARVAAGERFFVYVQPSDPHVPYWVSRRWTEPYHPQPYEGIVGQELDGHHQAEYSGDHEQLEAADYAWIRALYRGEVSYHDHHMGLFFERLEALGVLDETLVVVTNDHGEELDDHGRMGHGHSLYEELLWAPLLMRLPVRLASGARTETVVEGVDVPATVLDALGLEVPAAQQGRSLLEPLTGARARAASAVATWRRKRRAVRVGDAKLVVSSDGAEVALYDLARDRAEQTELSARSPVLVRRLALALAQAHAHPDKSTRGLESAAVGGVSFAPAPSELEPELRRQLEALGYLGEE